MREDAKLYIIVGVLAFIAFGMWFWVIAGEPILKTKACLDYEYHLDYSSLEPGYIECCDGIYENHKQIGKNCEIKQYT